ncbi:MAG: ATP-binding protein [Candidatus Lokiarchaeota archaeon]|nr:ATP-binding protein [Candidatus Lokiarchaeota archaeon]
MIEKTKKRSTFQIGLISGKGGVGKTSISSSFGVIFHELGKKVLVADCDVDAPNLGLLFQSGEVLEQKTVQTTEKSLFLPELCIQCKRCVDEEFCKFNALSWDSSINMPVVDSIACEGCGACYELCPEHAFEIHAIDSGTISHERTKYGFDLVWGETRLGAQTSGKLVTEIKKIVNHTIEANNLELAIIDGPPGIGCPVIATVTDLDYVIVIVEPTSTALHDADRAIQMLNQLRRNYGIVINKADMWKSGYDIIVNYAKKHDIEILGEIPVDMTIPQAIVNGLPVYTFNPQSPSSKALKIITRNIVNHFLS